MKKRILQVSFSIFSFILTALPLTACGAKIPDIQAVPGAEETDAEGVFNEEASGPDGVGEVSSPAPFSHAAVQAPADDGYTFPETSPFIDDTGKSIQQDNGSLYFCRDGRLTCYHPETEETVLLYQTASTHTLSFCLYGDFIYFVERTGYDSLDDRDTSLYRIKKDGQNLTLLQDNIINAGTMRDYEQYGIDVYDDMIYLLNYTSEYEDGNYVRKIANLYYKLEDDGSVREAAESETLYGMLPRHFSPVFDTSFPSFPYAMRNYGYLFVQDARQTLYRIDPVNGHSESLGIDTGSCSNVAFSGDTIFLRPSYEDPFALYDLTEKKLTPLDDPFWEDASLLAVFPMEEGFYYCARFNEEDPASGETVSRFYLRRLLPDGFVNTLIHNSDVFPFGYDAYFSGFRNTVCLSDDRIYFFTKEAMEHHLMSFDIWDVSDLRTLHVWSPYPASSPAVFRFEEKDEQTDIGENTSVYYSVSKLYLKKQTSAEALINDALSEVYADFESYIDGLIQEEQEQIEEDPEWYENFGSNYDFSLSVFCNYMDDDTISFDCSYYQYYGGAAHGYYWSDYYVFDRHTGKRLGFEDFTGDGASFIDTVTPYVEKMAGWDFEPEMLLEQSRFSLSEDGYTLYFAPYDIDCYAAGEFLITIPYEAFKKDL